MIPSKPFIADIMDTLGADGVDFVPICFHKNNPPPIICTYTREEIESVEAFPKSGRRYWKLIDGKKVYLNP